MFTEFSSLRWYGVALGALFIAIAFARLRRHAESRADVYLLVFSGGGLGLVSLFPGLAAGAADLLHLEEFAGRGIITLLILSTAALWLLIARERQRGEQRDIQFDRLARAFALREFFMENPAPLPSGSILVIMPAYNEADNLAELLPAIPSSILGRPARALVVDDGGDDDTGKVARERGALVARHPFNRGGGAALRAGYDAAKGLKAEIALSMDADGQHRPEDIAALVKPILDNEADIVIGSRVLGAREKDSTVRWVGIHAFNWVINLMMGTRITDCSSGFRAFRLDRLAKLRLTQDQYHTAELIIEAVKMGLRITERPVTIVRRRYGVSKKGRNLRYGVFFLRTVLKTWIR